VISYKLLQFTTENDLMIYTYEVIKPSAQTFLKSENEIRIEFQTSEYGDLGSIPGQSM